MRERRIARVVVVNSKCIAMEFASVQKCSKVFEDV
jgi:hypothetical protein